MHKRPTYIRMSVGQRSCSNKIAYAIFRLVTLVYTCVIYYIFPWLASFILIFVILAENNFEALKKVNIT